MTMVSSMITLTLVINKHQTAKHHYSLSLSLSVSVSLSLENSSPAINFSAQRKFSLLAHRRNFNSYDVHIDTSGRMVKDTCEKGSGHCIESTF